MVVFEPVNQLEVETPKGRGSVWLVTDYGTETEKVFTCVIKETGELWEFTNKDIRAVRNITFGRVRAPVLNCPSVSSVKTNEVK